MNNLAPTADQPPGSDDLDGAARGSDTTPAALSDAQQLAVSEARRARAKEAEASAAAAAANSRSHDKIAACLVVGLSPTQVSRLVGVSRTTVYKIKDELDSAGGGV